MAASTPAPAATPSPVTPSGMGAGAALSTLARATQAPAQATPAPSQAANQIMHAPANASGSATGSGFVPETGTPTQRAVAVPGGLHTQQSSMLHDLASISLGFANPVAPGQVTAQQKQVLDAWQQNAQSDYSQYMMAHGLSNLSENPGALFNEERLVAQSQWSVMDTKGAMTALKLSATDYDQWMKLEEEKKKSKMGMIFGVVELAAGIAIDVFAGWTGVGAVIGTGLAEQGAQNLSKS